MFKSISIIIFANILILLIYSQFQYSLEHNDGKGFDGVYYFEIIEQIQNNEKISTKAPFVNRLGTPSIIAFFFDDIIFGFKVINIIFSILISILIYFISIIYLDNKISILLSIIYQLHWISGIRYILFDPTTIDYIPLFLIYLSLYFILISHKYQIIIVVILSSIGVLFREICLLPIIIQLYKMYSNNNYNYNFLFKKQYIKKYFPLFIPFLIYLTLLLIIEFNIIEKTNNYNSIASAVKWIYIKGLGQIIHSIYIVFGLLIIIPLIFYNKIIEYKNDFELLYFLIITIFILSLIGGADTERIMNWSLPVFLIIITKIIIVTEFYKNILFYFIILILFLTFRIFWISPYEIKTNSIFPVLTYLSNDFNFIDLFAIHGSKKYTSIALFQYIFLSFVIILFYNLSKRKSNGN